MNSAMSRDDTRYMSAVTFSIIFKICLVFAKNSIRAAFNLKVSMWTYTGINDPYSYCIFDFTPVTGIIKMTE
jgi:hypothetical protein